MQKKLVIAAGNSYNAPFRAITHRTLRMNPKLDPYATKLHKRIDVLLLLLIIVVIAIVLRSSAHGQTSTYYWNDQANNGRWDWGGSQWYQDGFGFVGSPRTDGGAVLVFQGIGNTNTYINSGFSGGFFKLNTITLDSSSSGRNYVVNVENGGTGIEVYNKIETQTGGGSLTINAVTQLGADSTFTANGGTLLFGEVRTNGKTLSVNGSNNITLGDTVNAPNTGSLQKSGGGTLTLGGSGDNLNLSATVSGGTIVLNKASSSSVHAIGAGLTINNLGTVQLSGSGGDQIYDNMSVVALNSGGTLDLNGRSETISGLTGGGIVTNSSGTSSTLTLGSNDTTSSFSGSISNTGSISVAKTGAGTLTLTGNNSFTGATTINGGTLRLANSGGVALSGTSAITVNRGGTLLMGNNNQINLATTPPITLGSAAGTGTAKIDAGGFSQGNGSSQIGLGALTLASNSIIDLSSTSLLHFANSSANTWTGTLSIYNWSGTATLGNGAEQILFGTNATGLSVAQLNSINFYSDNGSTLLGTAMFAPDLDGEIVPTLVPVPEPSTWLAALLALGAVAFTQRQRIFALLRPAPSV